MKPVHRAAPIVFDPRHHLREEELALRWRIAGRTLQRWRRQGRAPAHLQLGQRILYRLCDVEAFEACHLTSVERS
jgi:hypothetical protein